MTLDSLLNQLAVAAGTTVGSFVIAVIVDVAAGVALAVKTKSFDLHRLPDFLESQFGTKKALALAGMVVAAATSAAGAALLHGLDSQALQGIADAGFAAATIGAAGMLLSVVADIFSKVSQLFGTPIPPAAASVT